ncbi:bifunctional diguanylate cyclase/phosphodiesterase [Oscillatoria sp. CS-180]|uniref:putative bifunctional diguanylate cyclase/phosphodiesterase n=1 Tax=Oscillatoria sp. CS-180 TaxID=3021720 RepID=UPI00232F6A4D|nr:bifunctional diguanylate cyclase/phosphodiesterase [Oscillatoria sp. CS-180]MDB9524735.1 bifunctional diguanylate cyclase/phosphodiesterase [Oscillatoria sp. CS-180]
MSTQPNNPCTHEQTSLEVSFFDTEAALRLVVEGTSAVTGESFFQSLVHYLACALNVRYALITQCLEHPSRRVETLAFWQGDSFGKNFSYSTINTPCKGVLEGQECYYPNRVQQLFPCDIDLAELNAVAYLGVPVVSSAGSVLGHLVIMHDQPLKSEPIGLSIMKIFAVRAAAEMERQAVMERLLHDSLHDSLTGLPNRTYFIGRLTEVCNEQKHCSKQPFAVLFLDLDRFKIINDSLGHAAGNLLLIKVSQRLSSCLRAGDTVARLSGDEFAILLENTESYTQVLAIVRQLQKSFTTAFQLEQRSVHVGVSIGIVFQSPTLRNPTDYLQNADLAMYQAKRQGGGEYRVFNEQMHAQAINRLNQEAALRQAIDTGELQLHYQPIFSLLNKQLSGFEALLRWWCPIQQRYIPPTEFIPLAEETGLIIPLGWWVIQTACYQLRTWQTRFGCPDLKMNINVSNLQFEQDNLIEKVLGILNSTGAEPKNIRFELTETMMMVKPEKIAVIMQELRLQGVQFHLDDFGQGFSSLSLLHELPIDALKIDRSFVSRMTTDKTAKAIVKTTMALADSLEIDSIAEGIETPEQVEHLHNLKCRFGQGYLIAPPMPSQAMASWIESYSPMQNSPS